MQFVRSRNTTLVATLVALAGTARGGQSIATWNGAVDNRWSIAANWSPAVVPNNGLDQYAVMIGGGNVSMFSNATVDLLDLDSTASLTIANSVALSIVGDPDPNDADETMGFVNNRGLLRIDSNGNATIFRGTSGTLTLGDPLGTPGTVELDASHPAGSIAGQFGDETLINLSGHTIQGRGFVGTNTLILDNRGEIRATASTLEVDPDETMLNSGILRAANGAHLRLRAAAYDNTAGLITADAGSLVDISGANITSGTLAGDGTINITATSQLTDVTNTAALSVSNGVLMYLKGTLTNNASFTINSVGNATYARLDGDVMLTGGGTFAMSNRLQNAIYALTTSPTLYNMDNLIRGAGSIGLGDIDIVNNGVIQADVGNLLDVHSEDV